MKRWDKKRVVVLGIARQGKALARFLTSEGASVVMSDMKTEDQLVPALAELSSLDLEYAFGGHPIELLDDTDALFLSGGVPTQLPIVEEAGKRGIELLNDAQLFLQRCPSSVIGITGSAGKTTTTTLVYEMARRGSAGIGRDVWLGGNIGRSLLDDLDNIKPGDLVVMELSSFQLELMTISPGIAAVLNITPDHLDRHGTMQAYIDAKQRILAFQESGDVAVLGYDDPGAWSMHQEAKGKLIAFGYGKPERGDAAYVDGDQLVLRSASGIQPICSLDQLALRGAHNVRNILAACAMCSVANVPVEAMNEVARNFAGVPHRLEFVREVNGVTWYNDSIATTPDRARAALVSFDEPLVILLGGRDKDLQWEAFASEVVDRARVVILFGEARQKLEAVFHPLLGDLDEPKLLLAEHFDAAFKLAAEIARKGDVVLLSPGCTSYDEFPNFEERGARFKEMVGAL